MGKSIDMQWIPIGRGTRKEELEKVIELLKRRWTSRYEYRIEHQANGSCAQEPYRLFVKHR